MVPQQKSSLQSQYEFCRKFGLNWEPPSNKRACSLYILEQKWIAAVCQPWLSTESQEREASLVMHTVISSGPQFLTTASALFSSNPVVTCPGSKDIRLKHCQDDGRSHRHSSTRPVTTSVIAPPAISEDNLKEVSTS